MLAALTASSYSLGYNLPNEGIWKSTDAGQTWVKTLDQTFACDVMFHPEDPYVVYATIGGQHEGSGFYISNDLGETWMIKNTGIPRVLCDPADENTMYIVRNGFSEGNKIYKTTDLGESWVNISGDLPDIPCLTLFVNPYHPNQIFVGTDLGVYISDDWGETYYFGGGDMPIVPVQDFEYVYIGGKGYLRLATYGRSIYETVFLWEEIEEYYKKQGITIKNHPNPFYVSANIEYILPEASNIRISIHDNLGKEVKVLVNETRPAGYHKVTWDGSDLTPGIYFCVFMSESGKQTTKIIKL